MSPRNDLNEPSGQDHSDDVLSGEDVTLDQLEFTDGPDQHTEATQPAPLQESPAELTPEPAANPKPSSAPHSDPAVAPESESAPVDAEPMSDPTPAVTQSDFPGTPRIDTATAEDLADSTSVLDTDFSAPLRDAALTTPLDVLQARESQPVVSDDGQSLLTPTVEAAPTAVPAPEVLNAASDSGSDTMTFRRSLISQPEEPQEPLAADSAETVTNLVASPTATESFPAAPPKPVADEGAGSLSESRSNISLLEGASVLPSVPSRMPSRWLSAIGTVLLAPLAWYLLTDSAVRMVLATDNPWATGNVNLAALAEMAGGLAVLTLIGILATRSSLGLFLAGATTAILGIPFLVAPGQVRGFLDDRVAEPLSQLGAFGNNVTFHLNVTGGSGVLLIAGFAMLGAAMIAYHLRRSGRAEEALRAEVAVINPDGLRARWARKATNRTLQK